MIDDDDLFLSGVCVCVSQLKVVHSAMPIKSIELQLIRVETCGCAEGYARDGTCV